MEPTYDSLEPTYPFWIAKDLWNVTTFAALLAEIDPDHLRYVQQPSGTWEYQAPPEKENALGNIEVLETWFSSDMNPFSWIDKAIKNRTEIPKKLWNAIRKKFLSNYEYDSNITLQYPAIAKKLKLNLKNETTQESISESNQINIPPYLDESHPNFSLELKIAVTAWIKLYSPKDTQPTSVEKLVTRILEDHSLEPSNASVTKRIATLITPNTLKVKRGAIETLRSRNKPN